MILTALAAYYDALVSQDKVPLPGWGLGKISFALSLSPEGEPLQIISTMVEVQNGKKSQLRPQEMQVPEPANRTVGVLPNLLFDNPAYILGFDTKAGTDKANPVRTRQCFDAAAALHISLLESVDSPAAKAIVSYFKTWNPEAIASNPLIVEHADALKGGGNLVFRIGGAYAHNDPAIRAAIHSSVESAQADAPSLCLVTGKRAPIARLHPKIKGVFGAQSSGASLVSFNAEAYNSWGKEQGANAPVSEAAAFAYGTALNYLLSDRAHTVRLGDTTVVFWAKGGQVAPQTMMAGLFGAPNVDERDLKAAMDRIAAGKTARWEDEEISPESEFYILGLAPNAARLSVRFFLRDTFGAFVKRMAEHQARLEIVKPQFDSRQQLSFWQLLHETVNPNAKSKEAAPVMAGELIRAVLTGTRYPATLLNCVMLRIRAEREITRGRAAIIKAYYLKNPHPDCPKEVLTMELSTSKNIPYCLGQAFCILEAIQQEANPGINATIKDKYFNSASATPAGVFPILVNLAQKHLRKLTAPKAIYHNRLLTSALAPVGEDYPARLSLAQQGSFQLGYYHATQKRFEKKEEKENA